MKTSRFSDAQIIAILKQAESGAPVPELCREHDLNQVGNLLDGKEEFVFADAGYQGAENRE